MECSICLNLLTNAPASLISGDLDVVAEEKKSNKYSKKPSRLCCTPCGHVFHRSCLLAWLRTLTTGNIPHQSCPICRKKVIRCKLYPVHLTPGNERRGEESRMSNEANMLSSSGKTKLTSMRSFLQRILFCVSPSPSSSVASDQGVPQQLQVAVTISGVIPVSEAHAVPNTGGTHRMCDNYDCPCPNHNILHTSGVMTS